MRPTYKSTFIDNVRRNREQAARCRHIVPAITDGPDAALLTAYAIELEERAELFEGLAGVSRGRAGQRRDPPGHTRI